MSKPTRRAAARLDDFALAHLAEHVARSNAPHRIHALLTPEYVRRKRAYFGSSAAVVTDIDLALSVAAVEGDFAAAFRWALARDTAGRQTQNPLIAVETILRARSGEHQAAIAMAEGSATPDELALARAEAAVSLWHTAGPSADEHLSRLEAIAARCSPTVLEAIAVRLAAVAPARALDIVEHIPKHPPTDKSRTRESVPSRADAVAAVLCAIARHDWRAAWRAIEGHHNVGARAWLLLDLGLGMLRESPARALACLRDGVRLAKAAKSTALFGPVMGIPLLEGLADLDPAGAADAFFLATQWVSICAESPLWAYLVDRQIDRDPAPWISALAKHGPSRATEYAKWRLIERGHLPLEDSQNFVDPTIRDLVQAKKILSSRHGGWAGQVGPVMELRAATAIARVLGNVACEASRCSERTGSRRFNEAFQLVSSLQTRSGFYGAIELLRSFVAIPGRHRAQVLNWCLRHVPEADAPAGFDSPWWALGQVLAEALQHAQPRDAHFFRSLMGELDQEQLRARAAFCMVVHGQPDVLTRMARCRRAYGLRSRTSGLSTGSRCALLTCLVAPARGQDQQLAIDLIHEAVATLPRVDHADIRAAGLDQEIAQAALETSPLRFWQLQEQLGGSDPTDVLVQVLRGAAAPPWNREQGQRLRLSSLAAYATQAPDQDLAQARELNSAELWSPLGDSESTSQRWCSAEWLRECTAVLLEMLMQAKARGHGSGGLHQAAESIARVNWDTFVSLMSDPRTGPGVLKDLNARLLAMTIFESEKDVRELCRDAARLRDVMARAGTTRRRELGSLEDTLIAAAAAYDPASCCSMLKELAPPARRKALGQLWRFEPRRPWAARQLHNAFDLLETTGADEEAVVAGVRLLMWLQTRYPVASGLVLRLVNTVKCLSASGDDPYCRAAAALGRLGHQAAAPHLRAALRRAVRSWRGDLVIEILRASVPSGDGRPIDVRAAVKGRHGPVCSAHPGHNATLLLPADVEHAWGAIEPAALKRALADTLAETLAELAPTDTETDVTTWLARVAALVNASKDVIWRCTTKLIHRSMDAGLHVTNRTLKHLTDRSDKVDILLAAARRIEGRKRERMIARAERVAERAYGTGDSVGPLCLLARFWAEQDPSRAVSLAARAVHDSSREEFGERFMSYVVQLARLLMCLGRNARAALGPRLLRTIEKYKVVPWAPHVKPTVRVLATAVMLDVDRRSSANLLRKLVRASARTPDSSEFRSLAVPLMRAAQIISEHRGWARARSMVRRVIAACPKAARPHLVDRLIEALLGTAAGPAPLARFSILQRECSQDTSLLLADLLPECSVGKQPYVHLQIGVNSWRRNKERSRREFARAAKGIQGNDSSDGVNSAQQAEYRDDEIWLAYAATNGIDACRKALRVLFAKRHRPEEHMSALAAAALEHAENKEAFIRDLWASAQSVVTYQRVLQDEPNARATRVGFNSP